LYRAAVAIEDTQALDRPVRVLAPLAEATVGRERPKALLGGRWLGHALHPLLTDLPLGSWMSATLLDLVGGKRSETASERLLAFGVLAALPTAAAGWTDWVSASPRERRVGVVHAAVNTTALACYGASLAQRRRGRHGAGVALAIAGGSSAVVGGFLGGHLSLARDTGLRSTASALGVTSARRPRRWRGGGRPPSTRARCR
jgi:uncharacterized membrane protein